MDASTLGAYDAKAKDFADDWEAQPPPTDLHEVVRRFFTKGGATADIGCGAGRDTAWLAANGYPAKGFDASDGLLNEARARHPGIGFAKASLPALAGIAEASLDNILCETVIMHLPEGDIAPSLRRMLALLKPGGALYLSWRVTEGADRRDEHGRLYAAFDPALVLDALKDTETLLDEQRGSLSSGKLIRRMVVRKHA